MRPDEAMQAEASEVGQRAKRRRARPPSSKSRASEERIYAAAAALFDRKGYAATSLQDIADEAGMVKGSLYYYIDSKQDLLIAITRRIHDEALHNLERSEAFVGDARVRLTHFIEGHVLGAGGNGSDAMIPWVRVFYTEFRSLDGRRLDDIMEQRHAYERHMQSLVDDCKAEGWACPELDSRLATTALLTMVNSVYMWYDRRHGDDLASIAAGLRHLAVQGLTCPPEHDHTARNRSRRRRAKPANGG